MTNTEANTMQYIDAIKREDYILLEGERVAVTRVTNKEVATRHLDKNIPVYVVKDDESGFLAAIASKDYLGRTSKAERFKAELVEKMVAQGLTKEQAMAVIGG